MLGLADFIVDGANNDLAELHFNESTTGLAEFSAVLDRELPGDRALSCLEIGSGSGILLARLKERYPQHRFKGIEPVSMGFARFEASVNAIQQKYGLEVVRTTFEAFADEGPYDFIYSLNVIEHVASWRDAMRKMHRLLAPGGVGVFLCPNYSFPYEPHYALPLVLGKDLTHRIFRKRIAAHDARHETHDLWESLNMIKKREVMSLAKAHGIEVAFDEGIMTRMIEKLWTDENFARRQAGLAGTAKTLHRLGVTKLVESFPLNLLSPYMKVLVKKGAR